MTTTKTEDDDKVPVCTEQPSTAHSDQTIAEVMDQTRGG